MDWRFRVAKLAILGRVPFGDYLRRLKRHHFGYPPNIHNLRSTLNELKEMESELLIIGRSFHQATVLEIGSGWFPTIPIMLSILGAKHVYMSDLTPHMDHVTFQATIDFLRKEKSEHPKLWAASAIDDFPLTYLAPFRLGKIQDGSIDFIISRSVLEHIPKTDLSKLLTDLRPKLSANGLMVHCVDHSDHLEHYDKSLSKVAFLTWSDSKHALINWLTKDGENRLRHHEYLSLFEAAGYEILREKSEKHEATKQGIPRLKLSKRFEHMSPDEIAILRSVFITAARCQQT